MCAKKYINKQVYKQMLPWDAAWKDKCMKLQTNQSVQQTRWELQYIVVITAVFCRILPSGPPSMYRWCNDKETLWTLDTCRTAPIYELHKIPQQHAQIRSISLLSISFSQSQWWLINRSWIFLHFDEDSMVSFGSTKVWRVCLCGLC